MDVAAFSGENFEPKDWINKALRNSDPAQTKEAAASSLVMKLQLMIAKLNSALEEQCQNVAQSIPRVVRDAEQLQQEAALLRDKLTAVKSDVAHVEQQTEENMHTLVIMDRVKERLSDTTRALQEADNWTTLDNQVEDAFENNDLDLVSEKLVGMQGSLRLLQHVVDFQERVDHLESHRNRLEATLSPQLVTAFSNLDRSGAERLVGLFRKMERGKQLTKYYTKCVRASLLQRWNEIVNTSEEGGFAEWLDLLYNNTVARIREHREWCLTVFPGEQPGVLMCDILIDVFASLDPTLDFCLEAGLKLQSEMLQYLVELRSKTDRFVADLKPLIQDSTEARQRELGKLIFSMYRPYIARYGELETQSMSREMAGWSVGGKDTIEEIHSLVGSVAKLQKTIAGAGDRCVAFTKGVGFLGLSEAVRSLLDTHLDRYRKLMRRLEKRKVVVDDDWSVLQHCLAANQATGDLLLMVEEMDMALSLLFIEASRCYFGCEAGDDPLQQHHVLLLDSSSNVKLSNLYAKVCGRSGSSTPILCDSLTLLSSTCGELQKATFNIMFHPVSVQLDSLAELEIWDAKKMGPGNLESDMPDFSFSPQEYITQIGEYLMTLPQHLEPYMSGDTSNLARAFREAVFPGATGVGEAGESPADFLLGCIAASLCQTYIGAVSQIPALTNNSARQLAVDIGYLGDILDDLGHPLSADLSSAAALLRLPASSYRDESGGFPPKIVQTIRTIRGIE